MESLKPVNVQCPYCGESIELMIDCSAERQEYVEDCHVCCKPMTVMVVSYADDVPQVEVRQENE
jgi:hypothetical protein